MRDRFFHLALLVLAAMLCLGLWPGKGPTLAHGARPADTTVTLFPMADAYVDEQNPATNFNTAGAWPVARRETSGLERYPLLKFDLSGIPVGSQVTSAELRLFLDAAEGDPSVSITVSRITLAWNETTVKWNNRPPDQCCWDSLVVGQPTGQDRVWDIRTLVNNWVSGGNIINHGLTLNGPATGFYGRFFEAAGARRPRLVVNYIAPTATPTASPTPTATGTATEAASATPTNTATATATTSPTPTATETSTVTASATSTASPTTTATATVTPSETATPEPSPTGMVTPSPTASATGTEVGTATATPGPSATATDSPSATVTPVPSASATATEAQSPTPPPSATATGTTAPQVHIYLPWLSTG